MTTTHHAISVAAGAIQAEAADLCALGPALSAERLQECIRIVRLSLAQLEASQRILEGSERPERMIGMEPLELGGWWK